MAIDRIRVLPLYARGRLRLVRRRSAVDRGVRLAKLATAWRGSRHLPQTEAKNQNNDDGDDQTGGQEDDDDFVSENHEFTLELGKVCCCHLVGTFVGDLVCSRLPA